MVTSLLNHFNSEGSKVICYQCFRHCSIPNGTTGFCKTKLHKDGILYSLNYGSISSVEISQIEKKPFINFYSNTKVFSIGSYGCNLRCPGCQNSEISWGENILQDFYLQPSNYTFIEPQNIINAAIKHECQGIAFTFNEPAVWLEYVLDVSKLAKENSLYTVYVTNCSLTRENLDLIGPYIDAMAADIKSMSDDHYQRICRGGSVSHVLDIISHAQNHWGIHIETRTNIIPTLNDDFEMLRKIANWIYNNLGADSPWHLTRFLPAHELTHLPPTSMDALYSAQQIGKEVGLKFVEIFADAGCD